MRETATGNPFARRREAGAFLRSRRGRLAPSQVGLPQGFRRRTPGLRREEVAMLAGVGTTWYTWLEQGREIQPSDDVLLALAGVLRLDAAERRHLFALYDRPAPQRRQADADDVDEPLRRMMDGLTMQPALVLGGRWDILSWNRAAEAVLGLPPGVERPNIIERLFCDPAQRRLFADWETVAQGALATFRADCAPFIGDPEFESLIARLMQRSAAFAAWWPRHDVAHRLAGIKRLDHPVARRMQFAFQALAVADRPGMNLFVFTAVDDDDTPRKLSRLLA
ncbi:MAG TPA: helix-turn-helix transcriptional regulator [Rhizomicrobium sp.]|jgi:PAS domain-containing protein|nr:helix-turn-helix transcriptional regulator [Rhizomicrobium sp.]